MRYGLRVSELKYITVEAVKKGKAVVSCKNKTRVTFIVRELRKKLLAYAQGKRIRTGCFGKDAEVTVPAMIAGIPVNTIASGAFTGNRYIQILNLPDTISKVGRGAIADGIKVVYNANTDHPQGDADGYHTCEYDPGCFN